jgi:hypothetical protein
MDRRRFMMVVGGSIAYVSLRPHLAWARKAAVTLPPLQPWTLPAELPGSPLEVSHALIGAAVLAPNQWNSQPWRFEVEGGSIRIVSDSQRALPITDPDQRRMLMSLGAALENLLVAARAYGLRTNVTYFPHDGAGGVVADVSWSMGETHRDRALFVAITERRTNRRKYDGRGIFPQNRAQLLAQVPEGFRLHWMDDREQIERVADLARTAVEARIRDPRAQAEQYAWMRFGDDQARERGDGVTIDALEVGGPAHWLAGRYFNPQSWFIRFGAENAGKQARAQIRSSGALVLLTTGRNGPHQWLAGGQAYERFALKATQLGVAHQPIDPPLAMEETRTEILRRFGAGDEEPLALVRLGHAKRPSGSVRRGVAAVASFRNS